MAYPEFSSPIEVFFLFLGKTMFTIMFLLVFVPYRGFRLISMAVDMLTDDIIPVFVPYRGFLLISVVAIQKANAENGFRPLSGFSSYFLREVGVSMGLLKFSSPIGVFFLFLMVLENKAERALMFSSPIGVFFLFLKLDIF